MGAFTTLTITGSIGDQDELDCLVEAIQEDGPEQDGYGTALGDLDDIREAVATAIERGKAVVIMEENREGAKFRRTQNACRQLGLSYSLELDMSLENEDAGHTEVWMPGMEKPLRLSGSSFGGGPYVEPHILLPLLKEGRNEEALRIVEIAANPSAAMPDRLSAGFDLKLDSSPSA